MRAAQPLHTYTFAGAAHHVYSCVAGEGLPRHEHSYPHTTICHAGRCVVRKDGREHILTPADGAVVLRAGEWHEIEALEDGTRFENTFVAGAA
jgi:quercetin dioxygenase-like cupin family protein